MDDESGDRAAAMLEAALGYAARGWPVFPIYKITAEGRCSCKNAACSSPGKHPLTLHGLKDATTDETTIRAWWTKWESANIGIVTGRASGIAVLDVDPQHGGDDSLFGLERMHGELPNTVEVITGGGGRHVYFLHPENGLTNSAGKLGPGLDIRGDGGYVVAPPSNHTSGGQYRFDLAHLPGDVPITAMPGWLLDATTIAHQRKTKAAAVANRIPTGKRNSNLTSLAGSMRRRGMSEDEIEAALQAANKNRCNPPLAPEEVHGIAFSIAAYEPKEIPGRKRSGRQRLGARLSAEQIEEALRQTPTVPDPALRSRIIATLLALGKDKDAPTIPILLRRQEAGVVLLDWLSKHGGLLQTMTGALYYFHRDARKLYNLETSQWAAFLYALAGTNPAGTDFGYLQADCKAAALQSEFREVLRVAAWDSTERCLRVSRFDGTVYRLDGKAICEEANGESVLFEDDLTWEPYLPNFKARGVLDYFARDVPNWEGNRAMYGLALKVWVLSSFFTELCPTRPLLVVLGEKGSGKSMSLRLMLRLLFGSYAEVSGVPDKPDGFTAAVAACHVLVIDNLDDFTPWLRDKLARSATGATDEYRKLYTSNELGRIRYRCWIALTARTPDTLRRDDLADRLVLLRVKRIEEGETQPERIFLESAAETRNDWWGEALQTLNALVAKIRNDGLPGASRLRMADWESLGRVVAELDGVSELWTGFIDELKSECADFVLEGDLIAEGLGVWLQQEKNHGREVQPRELRDELGRTLFGDRPPTVDWPKSAAGFGKRLNTIRRELRALYDVQWRTGSGRRTFYSFRPKSTIENPFDALDKANADGEE